MIGIDVKVVSIGRVPVDVYICYDFILNHLNRKDDDILIDILLH